MCVMNSVARASGKPVAHNKRLIWIKIALRKMKQNRKFRVWDVRKQRFLSKSNEFALLGNGKLIVSTSDWYKDFENTNQSDYVVQLCSGLKDHRGLDIYEGDIVTVSWLGKSNRMWVVAFVPPKFIGVSLFSYGSDIDERKSVGVGNCWYTSIDSEASIPHSVIEIIGNVNENPELLEAPDTDEQDYKFDDRE